MKRMGRMGMAAMVALTVTASALVCAPQAEAQQINLTNAPAPPANTGSFFSSAVGYFSSFDTNLDVTFGANRGTFWTSVDAIQGGPTSLANSIGISYDIWRATPPTNQLAGFCLSAENVVRNGGVTGTVISEGAGLGLSFVVHDVRLTGYIEGVYNFNDSENQFVAELGLRVVKALGTHTFAGVGAAFQFPGNRQIFSGIVGFTF